MSNEAPTYPYVKTTLVPPPPKVGDKRRVNVLVKKGNTYTRKREDGSKYEFTLTQDVYMDVEQEYSGSWIETSGYLETAVPAPTKWGRFKQWLGLSPRIPTARVVEK